MNLEEIKDENYEEVILSANTGKIMCRYLEGKFYLGVDQNPDPEEKPIATIEMTPIQRSRIIDFLSMARAKK